MESMKMKGKILQEIIDLMGEEEGKKLKNHPKLMAAKITVAKPLDKVEEMPVEDEPGEGPQHELDEGPKVESIEDVLESLPEELKAKIKKFIK